MHQFLVSFYELFVSLHKNDVLHTSVTCLADQPLCSSGQGNDTHSLDIVSQRSIEALLYQECAATTSKPVHQSTFPPHPLTQAIPPELPGLPPSASCISPRPQVVQGEMRNDDVRHDGFTLESEVLPTLQTASAIGPTEAPFEVEPIRAEDSATVDSFLKAAIMVEDVLATAVQPALK